MPDDSEKGQAEAEPTMPDLEAVYDEKICPLMVQIIEICKEHELPFVACFQFSETGFCTSAKTNPAADKRFPLAFQILRHGFLAAMTIAPSVDPAAGGSNH